MSESVGGEAAGGGADTELKTKTPHVNVGNNAKHSATPVEKGSNTCHDQMSSTHFHTFFFQRLVGGKCIEFG